MMRLLIALAMVALSLVAVAGDCKIISRTCAEGAATRTVQGIPVYRDCWRWHAEYECLSTGLEEHVYCGDLRSRGCSQVGSRCATYSEGICVTYEQSYECPSDAPPEEQQIMDCATQTFCMDGNCFDSNYPPNTNMAKVGALVSVMEAISDELEANTFEIFKGDDRRCGVSLFDKVGAHNCCSVDGWATGVFECSFDEEMLAELRSASRCHYVGTYCSNKDKLGICWEDTQSYCCFGSKLARIIAEQARIQVGRPWGGPKAPDCAGFSTEEVEALNFDAMDLSEFYADVMATMPSLDANELQDRMNDRMEQLMP